MTPADLADRLHATASKVLADRGLDPAVLPGKVDVRRPRDPEHGDYATNLALHVAKNTGADPRDLAGWLAEALGDTAAVASAEVAGPGFVNIRLTASAQSAVLEQVRAAGAAYGTGAALAGTRIPLDSVSTDPTDPLYPDSACWAPVGDALGRILAAQGAAVTREHHVAEHAARSTRRTPDTVETPIGQTGNPLGGGMAVRTSTRAETVVTFDDLVEAIGLDAARYALVRGSMSSSIVIDLDQWTRHDTTNPVYYVQYTHARAASLVRNATEFEFNSVTPDFTLLTAAEEGTLIRAIGEFPRVVEAAAIRREPHRVARFLEELADAYHPFRTNGNLRVLPRGDDPVTPVAAARLTLVDATRQVLANALGLLGVTAPERM